MARGITESDVHTAADEIVAAGDRPTVERIRAHLGTGSPNTVTRWLETWWQRLGVRLEAQHRRIGVPEAPEAVMALAGEWWALALEHARTTAAEALTHERNALQAERDTLRQEREDFAAEAAALREKVEVATHAERLASTQAAELQRLVSQLEGHVEEKSRQRDVEMAKGAALETARQAVETRLQELQDSSRAERENLSQHVRAVEDRAHIEIDRARQENKELQIRLNAATKEHAAAEKLLFQAAEHAKALATDANREAGIERARAGALEAQLAKLQDLPAALEAAMRRSEIPPKQRMIAGKRAAPVPRKRARVTTD